jgi:hypothetical protein
VVSRKNCSRVTWRKKSIVGISSEMTIAVVTPTDRTPQKARKAKIAFSA